MSGATTYSGEVIQCGKCCGLFASSSWKKCQTYKGIDRHHNPPEFLSDFLKEKWSGEFYDLCRKCHRELHDLIIKILNKKADTMKFINSEYWILQKMNLQQIKEVKDEIYSFTVDWIKEKNDNNTKST